MLSYETERQTENSKRRYCPSGQKDVQTTVKIGVVLQSVRAFGKALKIDPLNRMAAASMSDVLCSQGKCEEAVEWCERIH